MNRAKTYIAAAVVAACGAWPLAVLAQAGSAGATGSAGTGASGSGTTSPSDSARATTGNTGTTMGSDRYDGTLGQASGRSDADWERGRASSYSLLPMTSYGYVGGNIGRANWSNDCGNNIFNCDDTGTGWKIYTGGLLSRMVGLELGYINFGRPEIAGDKWTAHGINASIVANLPLEPVNLFARFGTTYGWTETNVRAGSGLRAGEDDGFGIAYGLGIGYDVAPNFQITAEWDRNRFKFVNGDEDLDLYSIGLRYKF
jgi:hypothetical protein